MKLKIVDRIAKHPFFKITSEDIKPELTLVYKEIKKRAETWDWISKVEGTLADPAWYRNDVFKKLGAILSVLDRIVYTHAFIQKFPSPRTYEKKFKITQYNWLEYHFFYYMINVVSLFDCLLILTNSVFRIGLKDRDCKRDLIINNHWVRYNNVDIQLIKFEKISNRYKEVRNLHLHRGKGKKMAEILNNSTLSFLDTVSFIQLYDNITFPREIIDKGFKIEVKDLLEKIENECDEIYEQLYRIFTELKIIYLEKRPPRTV